MTRETEKTNPFLPHDLITQILLRLPAKSLIRFRCVCKSWFSLISDPNFATLHFELGYARTERLVLFVEEDPEVKSIDIINAPSLFDDSASVVLKQLSFLLPFPFHLIKIIGSCRGLVLFDYFPYFFLWNPTTGVYKRLPPPSFYDFDADLNEDDPYLQGFGYDPLTDDYLVILVYYDLSELGYIVNRVEFLSFKANEWKEMEAPCFPYATSCRYFDPRAGLLFNGAIHWIAFRYDLDEVVILVFDLMERSFSEIALPDHFDCNPDFSKLWIFGGFLSVYAPPVPGIENVEGGIWVMEKYKVQTSWIKCHKLIRPDAIRMGFISPICCTKTGDTIVTNGRGLLKFNDKGELLEYRPYCDNSIGFDAAMYTESLLSLPSDSQRAKS